MNSVMVTQGITLRKMLMTGNIFVGLDFCIKSFKSLQGISLTRPTLRWISSTDTYKPNLAVISAQIPERKRERENGRV